MYALMNQHGRYYVAPDISSRNSADAYQFSRWADAFDARPFGYRIVELPAIEVTEHSPDDFENVTL